MSMANSSERPNILLITSDQHRGDTLGCAGHPCVRTPVLDQLAREGVRFSRAYTDCPVCIPARTTLITGIKSSRYGSPSYNAGFRIEREREKFMGSIFTAAGYQTCLVGKRHWHTDGSFKAGFETVIPIARCKRAQNLHTRRDGNVHGMGANMLNPSLSTLPPELYSTDWCVDRSIEWFAERERERPWFLWCSMVDPHPALAIHEPYYSMYDDSPVPDPVHGDWLENGSPLAHEEHRLAWGCRLGPDELRKARGVYYGMVSNVDHQLARLLGTLQRAGELDNTLIIYTSDHGEMLGDHGNDAGKTSFYNASANVPMIIRRPRETQPGRVSDSLMEWADVLPTLCDAAGIDAPDDIDGVSAMPVVTGDAETTRDVVIGHIGRRYMVHDGVHKYLYHSDDGAEQLFAADDQHDEHALPLEEAVVAPLRARLVTWLEEVGQSDVTADGTLVNHGRTLDEAAARAQNPLGLGHSGRRLGFDGAV